MKTPHKHAHLIKAWADGATIQFYSQYRTEWVTCEGTPAWDPNGEYRVKPEPKPDYKVPINLVLAYDGETGKLKSVELIK